MALLKYQELAVAFASALVNGEYKQPREIGLDPQEHGVHSMCGSQATLMRRRTKNLRAVWLRSRHPSRRDGPPSGNRRGRRHEGGRADEGARPIGGDVLPLVSFRPKAGMFMNKPASAARLLI